MEDPADRGGLTVSTTANEPIKKSSGESTSTTEPKTRGSSQRVGRTIAETDAAAAGGGDGPSEEQRGDQRGLDGDDRHLDDDRYFDPEEHDPHGATTSSFVANKGTVVLEFYLDADNRASARVVGVRDLEAASRVITEDDLRARHLRLAALGRVLAEVNDLSIRSNTCEDGEARIVPMTNQEVINHPRAGAAFRTSAGKADHTFLSRLQDDLVRVPWSASPLPVRRFLGAKKTTTKGGTPTSSSFEGARQAWLAWKSLPSTASPKEQDAAIARPLTVAPTTKRTLRLYRQDFESITTHWDTYSAARRTAISPTDFRSSVDQQTGTKLNKAWLYDALYSGALDDPETQGE